MVTKDILNPQAEPRQTLKPLWLFFSVSAACSWIIWLWPLEQQGPIYPSLFGWRLGVPFALIKLLIGNCVPGILALVWTVFEGKQHFRRVLSSLKNWKSSPRSYLISITLPCIIYLIALDIVLLLFPAPHTFPPIKEFFKSLLMTLPFGPFWEEIAWRAYALRKLEGRYSRFASALFLGIYWAVWHIPLWLVTLNLNQSNRIPVLTGAFVNLVAWAFIFSFLYHRSSDSLPVVILLHATYVAASSQAGAVSPYRGVYLLEISAALSVLVGVVLSRRLHDKVSNLVPLDRTEG